MEKSKISQGQILITGGTGKTGRRIVDRLRQRDYAVRVGSRDASPKFDWKDSLTWENALYNIRSVYICFQPDLAVAGSLATIADFTKLAVSSGVQRLVLLSGRGEPEAEECEKLVMKSEVEWTIIRSSWFNQNFSESYFLDPILNGYVALPAREIGEPFIDVNDIADVAVAALTENSHHGQIYNVTGPKLLTFRQAVQKIAKATGKTIQYEQVPMDDYVSAMQAAGVPSEYISLIKYLFCVVLDGRNESLGDGVKRALGREPRDFSEYVKEVASSTVWRKSHVVL